MSSATGRSITTRARTPTSASDPENGDYEYNPLLHGPLRFYMTAGLFAVLGDTDFTARLAPALMGTLMVPLPYLLRRQLGRIGAFAAAVLLAFGPSYSKHELNE